ncbi:hypothetical protein [Streptomyces sp. CFMR 7]|uniref:hypothetical protein n=1 Tax=Streptomyces sp. CFMR 7 TaxID=1649184 RepID=UPI0011A0B161|nr:hypothetical protein [Streptomyces sp. CFMR 7]
MRELEIGKSLVLTEWLTDNARVDVHLDRMGSVVGRSEVTFFLGENPFDGGSCPAQPGDDWEAGVKRVKWWLGGNVNYRANIIFPKHGYSAMYCTNMPDCNCEAHKGSGDV